jgi:hypothetical protein
MHMYLNIAAGVSGLISGALWLWASWIPAAKQPGAYFAVLDSEGVNRAMRRVARRNQWAATFTAVASILAAAANFTPN